MRLRVDWRVRSPRLEQLLAIGCRYCDSPLGRLTRHDAGAGGQQVWLTCCECDARLGGPLEHRAHPWMSLYPAWREGLGLVLTPEEMRAPRPATWRELSREILNPQHRVLERFQDRLRTSGLVNIAFGHELKAGDLRELAAAFGVGGEYAVSNFDDAGPRLLRLEAHGCVVLAAQVIDGQFTWGRPIVESFMSQHP